MMGGGGGAYVVCYHSVLVNGNEATVQAVVAQWLKIGLVQNGQVNWQTEQANIFVNDTLSQTASSQWQVISRSWTFVPGSGPDADATATTDPSMACAQSSSTAGTASAS